jgi:hypothetical protein
MKYVIEVFRPKDSDGPAKCWLYGSHDGEAMEREVAEGLALVMRTEKPELTSVVLPLRPAP